MTADEAGADTVVLVGDMCGYEGTNELHHSRIVTKAVVVLVSLPRTHDGETSEKDGERIVPGILVVFGTYDGEYAVRLSSWSKDEL